MSDNMSARIAGGIAAVAATTLLLAACEYPSMETEQTGYRGTGMEEVKNPRREAAKRDRLQAPEPLPPVQAGGGRAGDVYQNVQVVGDLSITEFNRLMTAMTEWVSPEQGCNYCHIPDNLASDDIYTKVVSRRMMEMTKHINDNWSAHVGDTGVTCYTCHAGQPVPEYVWFKDDGPPQAGGMAARRAGQNIASASVGYSSLPRDPFSAFFVDEPESIRVIPTTALPDGTNPRNIMDTEKTYGLMMHFSDSLGVNCTYCHNSRSFIGWESSPPTRENAWHGIQMVRDLNVDYLVPLEPVYPESQLGPHHRDAPKTNCQTCHQGANQPLYGVSMLADYPELDMIRIRGNGVPDVTRDELEAPAEVPEGAGEDPEQMFDDLAGEGPDGG